MRCQYNHRGLASIGLYKTQRHRRGTIVPWHRRGKRYCHGNYVKVLWDGNKAPVAVCMDFLEPVMEIEDVSAKKLRAEGAASKALRRDRAPPTGRRDDRPGANPAGSENVVPAPS
jgi:hypothetical protein